MFRLLLRKAFNSAGYEVRRLPGKTPSGTDLTSLEKEILQAVRPFTMTSTAQLIALIRAVEQLSSNNVPGAIVECGVWRGGSIMAAALALIAKGNTQRDLYLYDTYNGMTPPTPYDILYDGRMASDIFVPGTPYCNESGCSQVLKNVISTGYPEEHIHIVEGNVMETLPRVRPQSVALLRLDTDWYDSTKHELEHLYPLIHPRGVVIVDDYGYCKGAQKAVDEYFAPMKDKIFMHRIDYTARLITRLPDAL